MEQSVGESRVRARLERQMVPRPERSRRPSWIDHDQRAAFFLLGLEILKNRRHRLRDIGADEQDDVGPCDVLDWKRQAAINAERSVHRAAAAVDMQNLPL